MLHSTIVHFTEFLFSKPHNCVNGIRRHLGWVTIRLWVNELSFFCEWYISRMCLLYNLFHVITCLWQWELSLERYVKSLDEIIRHNMYLRNGVCVLLNRFLLCSRGWSWTCGPLAMPSKHWDYRCAPLHFANKIFHSDRDFVGLWWVNFHIPTGH